MTTTESRRLARERRIAKERADMGLRPWQLSPSEVDDGANPYEPQSAGHAAWIQAQQWRREIMARDPSYFSNDGSKQ